MNVRQHWNLRNALRGRTRWVVSLDECDEAIACYLFQPAIEVAALYSTSKTRKTELIIRPGDPTKWGLALAGLVPKQAHLFAERARSHIFCEVA